MLILPRNLPLSFRRSRLVVDLVLTYPNPTSGTGLASNRLSGPQGPRNRGLKISVILSTKSGVLRKFEVRLSARNTPSSLVGYGLVSLTPSAPPQRDRVLRQLGDVFCSFTQPQLVRDVQWRLEVLPHCTPLPNLLLHNSNGLL